MLEKYRKFEIDREDMSICNEDVSLEPDLFIRLKKYIIKLRRTHNREDYCNFKRQYLEHELEFLRVLEARELISICDTIADYDEEIDCGIAMSLSAFINSEKFFLTFNHTPIKDHIKINGNIWGIRLEMDDAPLNYLYRLDTLAKKVPYLHRIYIKLLSTLLGDERSSLKQIMQYSGNSYVYSKAINGLIIGRDIKKDLDKLKIDSMNYKKEK